MKLKMSFFSLLFSKPPVVEFRETSSTSSPDGSIRQTSQESQLLAQLLDFSSPGAKPERQIWHLPSSWKWDSRGGPQGQVHFNSDEFQGEEYPDFTPEKNTKLGEGRSGEVHRVLCNGRILARKTTSIDPKDRFEMIKNIKEASIMKKLSHRHIAQICGFYVLETSLYSLYYPVAEMDLRQYMNLKRIYNPSWINTLLGGMGCLSNALAFTHASGIKHKDIHAGNILVLGSTMILCDWGASSYSHDQKTTINYHSSSSDRSQLARAQDVQRLGCVFEEIVASVTGEKDFSIPYKPQETPTIEKILQSMSSGPKRLSRLDFDCLIKVMTTGDLAKQLSARAVADYLRMCSYQWGFRCSGADSDGGEMVSETCGKCCM